MTIFCPSRQIPFSDSRLFTTSATCSGCMILDWSSSGAKIRRNSVAHRPGDTQYTLMPYSASSSDSVCDMLITAALEEAYASQPGRDDIPAVEATFKIFPPV